MDEQFFCYGMKITLHPLTKFNFLLTGLKLLLLQLLLLLLLLLFLSLAFFQMLCSLVSSSGRGENLSIQDSLKVLIRVLIYSPSTNTACIKMRCKMRLAA